MAYPAPPTPAAGAIPLTTPIITYLQKYRGQGDALEGRYQEFLAPYAPDSGRTHAQLEARILSTTAEVPKVFLGLVEHAGATSSVTLQRPTQYASHPVDASIWDGATLAFAGDVLAGNHIEIVRVPTTAFEVAPDNNIPTIAGLQSMLAAQPNTMQFGPFDDGAPDTQPMAVRNMVPIPPSYVHLVLDRALNPRALWEQVGGAVINDGRELECRELLNWLRHAITLRKDPGGTATALPPGSSLGAIGTALPMLRVDAPLQSHRWNILRQDLPALDPTRLAPTDQVVHLVQALRDEQAATRLAEVEARNRATALKTPSATFLQTAARWRTYCLAAGDDDLPPIYAIWANATKAERRVALQSALEERVNTGLAAGRITPLASKELYEIVLQGRFAASYHEVDDLTKGLQPFTCGFQSTERDRNVATRATQFDQMMAGLVAPSLAEQETFRTKEVPLPSTVYQLGTQLGCTSVVFDVVLGPIHPLAQDLRSFCLNEWPLVEAALQTSVDDSTLVLPIILRWFQIETLAYFRSLSMGRTAHTPNFQEITALIERRAYHLLPPLPRQYLAPATAPRPVSAAAEVPRSVGHPSGTPSGTAPDNRRDPGPRINNPNMVPEWGAAFNSSNTTIRALREFAPSTHDRDTQATVPICLSYHLRGSCYENCQRASTHRALSAAERRSMSAFVAQRLGPTSGGSNTTSTISTASGPSTAKSS